jgi:hypothetical protein
MSAGHVKEWILERGHRGRAVTSFRVERPARKPVRTLNEATPGGGVTSFSGSVRTRLEAVSGSAVEERLVEHETERPEGRSDRFGRRDGGLRQGGHFR